jgi:hypothetical protein
MISMVRMPSRREWEVVEGCTIHLTSSNHSLVEAPLEVCLIRSNLLQSLVIVISTHSVSHTILVVKVVAAVGAGDSVGGRMWFIL